MLTGFPLSPSRILKIGDYFTDVLMSLPTLISPLSIRMLKPHSGLLQTQALYWIDAPSRP